jgi:flagellar biosynthesis/type III secretory pathway protein FliH
VAAIAEYMQALEAAEARVAAAEAKAAEAYDEGYQDGYDDGREAALSEPEWEPDEDATPVVDVPVGEYL